MAGPVAHFFAAVQGGGQLDRVTLANALAEHDVETVCIVPRAKGPFLSRLHPRVELIDLNTKNHAVLVPRLARTFHRLKPRMVIASGPACVTPAMAARLLARSDARIVAYQGTAFSQSMRRRKVARTRNLLSLLTKLVYPRLDGVIATTNAVAEDLAVSIPIPRDKIDVIPCTTITPRIPEMAAEKTGLDWLDRKPVPVILAVGTLRKLKDHAMLIRAFALLRKHRLARLVILGEGHERPKLEELARTLGVDEDVYLAGFQPNPYAYMVRADVLAHSSHQEGLGNVLLEALACGCPVVSTDCPHGPREVLDGGRYGRLVPVGDEHAMAAALDEVLYGRGEKWSQTSSLRRRAEEFSIDRVVGRYLELIGDTENDLCKRAVVAA